MKPLLKIAGIIVLSFLLLLVATFFYFKSPNGQAFLTQKVSLYLQEKLHKPVSIQKISYDIPDWLALEGIYLPDNQNDTLFYGKKIRVDMDMLALISNQVKINKIELEQLNINLKRTLPDTTFNFNYILKAFQSTDTKVDTSKGTPFDYQLSNIALKQIKVSYLDDVTGIDAKVFLDEANTSFKAIDPSISKYHLDKIDLNGGNLSLRIYEALVKSPAETASKDTLDLAFGEFQAKKIQWKILEESAGLLNTVRLGSLKVKGEQLYLAGEKIHLKSVDLFNTDAKLSFLKRPKNPKKPTEKEVASPNNWQVLVDKIVFDNNNIQYQDFNHKPQKKGLDANYLGINNFKLNAERLFYSPNQISGWLYSSSFREKSGFTLQNFQTDFAYTNRQAFLKKLYVKTPNTILREEVSLKYASFEQLNKNIGASTLNVNLKNTQIGFKDILLLMPDLAKQSPFVGNENAVLKINALAKGTVNNLKINELSVNGLGQTKANLVGTITGLPNINKTAVQVNLKEISLTKNDILKLAPKNSIPPTIDLPQKISVAGTIQGKVQDLTINTKLQTDLGGASFKGRLVNITADKNQQYEGDLNLTAFEVGKLIKQSESVGKISLNAQIKGKGFDLKTMNTSVKGLIQQAEIKGYAYKNLAFETNIAQQIASIKAQIADPNINLNIDSKVDLSQKYPSINGKLAIAQLNLKPLGLYPDNIGIQGDIAIDMPITDPVNPIGRVTFERTTLFQNGKAIPIDNTIFTAQSNADGKNFELKSPFLKAKLKGDFNYLQLSDIFIGNISHYFAIPEVTFTPVTEAFNIAIDLKLLKHPAFNVFLPGLSKLDTLSFSAKLSNQAGSMLQADLKAPFIEYDTIKISNVNFHIANDADQLNYQAGLDGVSMNDFKIRKTILTGNVANNIATFKATFKDSLNLDKNQVVGFVQNADNQYRIKLANDGLKLNFENWNVDSTGFIQYGKAGLLVNHFQIEQAKQRLLVNTENHEPNGAIRVLAENFKIENFVTLFVPDSTMASGKIDGDILLSNYMTSPSFTGNINISNFNFQKTAIGDVAINAFNETAEKITVKATLLSAKNDVQLVGNYLLNTANPFDLNLKINSLGLETVQAFSFGQLKQSKGVLFGEASIKGSSTQPELLGNLNFKNVGFTVSQLGSRYLINNQKLIFDKQTIQLNQFIVSDTLNQPLKIDGTIVLANIPSVKYDLNIDTKNFMVLNSTRNDNDFFYGKGFVDASLSVQGISTNAKVEGDIKVREKSNISIIVPDDLDAQSESEGIVVFVNKNTPAPPPDTLAKNTLVNDFVTEMSLNIEADDKSEFTIIVDELNGDNLKVRGNARLNAGLSADGQPYIIGSYDLTEGSYGITFEVLKRQFSIEKGSNIIWSGDPMNADVNITAIYNTETSPLDLMANETDDVNLYRQKVQFDVLLTMAGKLTKPDISFKIRPSATQRFVDKSVTTSIQTRLNKLDQNDVNKQVFALLILNRFFSEKSSDFFSSSGGANPEALARQSVSKLLSDQLASLASDLITVVDLDINLASTQDYYNGKTSARTDLSLGLSKAFFNDKIQVKVGRNFELENQTSISRNSAEVFDNIVVNYKLTNDGRYLFKAFRKNQFQSVLDGYVVETGLGFTVTMEYGTFKEIFKKPNK
ncbi:translocation/assembly module TamB domain-containing protein [Arcicella rigui]|uniref:Translocation/assembly module TamB domain-containing protein n=1 Tax=Arcicella rigui TaxID=797020 RepID=A0ABU5Q5X5_9BACT|nr:translocation/assembly module TamB domain-containing protein [Arcicella rigui]MEA5138220.1 translocation/assembly module TamB domain-containing protein [Arcicella rigui]